MTRQRFYFSITGDPADSPGSPNVDLFRDDLRCTDYDAIVAMVEAMADVYIERARYGDLTSLDSAATRAVFVADALRALSLFDPSTAEGSRVFAVESTDESCWRVRVRIYCES